MSNLAIFCVCGEHDCVWRTKHGKTAGNILLFGRGNVLRAKRSAIKTSVQGIMQMKIIKNAIDYGALTVTKLRSHRMDIILQRV